MRWTAAASRRPRPRRPPALSLVAFVRHALTDYDALLAEGYDRDGARFFVAREMREILVGWGVRRALGDED